MDLVRLPDNRFDRLVDELRTLYVDDPGERRRIALALARAGIVPESVSDEALQRPLAEAVGRYVAERWGRSRHDPGHA